MSVMSEVKYTVPFDGMTEAEVNSTGEFTFIGFGTIRKLLGPAVDLDEDEKITGFVIYEEGIKIRIDTT